MKKAVSGRLEISAVRMILVVIAAVCACGHGYAQGESFAEFRKKMLSDYNDFRSSVFENYDKFLEGAWSNYEQIKGEKSNPKPKPRVAPCVDEPEIKTPGMQAPVVEAPVAESPEKGLADNDGINGNGNREGVKDNGEGVSNRGGYGRENGENRENGRDGRTDRFRIGETELSVAHVDYNIANRLNTPQDFAAHWRGMAKSKLGEALLPEMKGLAERYGLNDYLLFEAVNAYVDARFPSAHSSARKSLAHYLLTGLGYDVRLGKTNRGTAMLLVPFRQMVYARPYLNIGGKKYFIFADSDVDLTQPDNLRISSCNLPTDADAGQALDLIIRDLRLPGDPQPFTVSHGGLTISGEFNKAIIPLLYRYPQMPTADYARSNVLPGVRERIVAQLKEQLEPMEKKEAVDRLLQFVQSGFEYATDEDFHGFEKPYFLEETLFYPKNDCEDRAIFYTYLLWEVLGVPNQLICFPGHESASVALEEGPARKGRVSSYTNGGATYYISDPTYIGAVTGMCMPDYEHETPTVDYSYK